ncbi:hypothetical protein [Streptomyces pseudovenezuelae]|uniref:hypothetical protein n=1 Tax=Streptomyces pseudovenezuelae TaxID=67350 RepID=UPI002E80D2C9|nr:hypothetical protein [Streptomyces pseudovenezuelae]WUA94505.1 hypothetical protein OHO81_44835 [Streptomyces pseudovenezuelae]
MRRSHRFALGILIPAAVAIAFAAVWIAATGTFRPPVWALITASLALGVLSHAVQTADDTPPRRWLPASRRAHARHATPRKRA